jgi:glycosyltransferase involved in cell wall biosynthesis
VKDGTSGFIVNTVEEALKAVRRIASLDRAKVRAEFERHFTAERMARDYLDYIKNLFSPARADTRGG